MTLLNLLTIVVFIITGTISGCTTPSRTQTQADEVSSEEKSIPLRLKGIPNVDEHVAYSASNTKTFSNNQIVHEQIEAVDFKIVTEIKPRDDQTFYAQVKTLSKDGPIALASLGYPEPGEAIVYIVNRDSTIIKAGEFPKNSLYFIPQLPLPNRTLKTGETWNYEYTWISDESLSQLKIEVVLLLKDVFECGKDSCITIEYSGNITQPKNIKQKIPFKSQLKGLMKYNLTLAQVISNYQINEELLEIEGTRVEAKSCSETLSSELGRTPQCDPLKPKHTFTF